MTDYGSFYLTLNAADPTRTLTLRSRFASDWKGRIRALQVVIRKSVVDNDGFGLSGPKQAAAGLASPSSGPGPSVHIKAPPAAKPNAWAYRWSSEKVKAFMAWLKKMEDRTLLEVTTRLGTARVEGEPWSDVYVRSAYQSGVQRALAEIKRNSKEMAAQLGLSGEIPSPLFEQMGRGVSAIMMQPFHADRLALAYTRVFDELKGVTAAMDQQISRVLTRGIAEGLNPRQIGAQIADRVDKIGQTRGVLIARTETIHVHNQAHLNEYYAVEEQTGEVILVKWSATMDSRTRPAHAHKVDPHEGWNGLVMTKEEAYSRLGRPNCRCGLVPWIPITMGRPEQMTDAAREIIDRVLKEEQ